jgi:pilus assembly protein Flp/PilA
MTDLIAKFHALKATRDQGATAVEYGLMVALIAVVIIAAVTLLGDNLAGLFDTVAGEVEDAAPAAP